MKISHFIPSLAISVSLLTGTAHADQVQISLADKLDGYLDNYCLDIKDRDTASSLQAHTCYGNRDNKSKDILFETAEFEFDMLYMPALDACVEVSHLALGSNVALATCNSTAEQKFIFSGTGTISPSLAPTMCLTASLDTRLDHNGSSKQQIKGLSLETCSADFAAFQMWQTTTAAK